MTTEISVTEVLAALEAYTQRQPAGGDGVRVEELCELSRRGERVVRRALARGLAEGTIIRTKRVIHTLNGRTTTVDAYKQVEPLKGKKGK